MKRLLWAIACLCAADPVYATTITFADFSSTAGLTLNGAATTPTTSDGTVLRLTPAASGQAGSAFSTSSVSFASSADTFSTFFQFRLTNPGGIDPADGIVFVVQPVSSSLGTGGGGIGYQGIPTSLGVEFDTYNNGEAGGSNHVGIDTNGLLTDSPVVSPYGVSNCTNSTYKTFGCMSNGDVWSVWIDYDGTTLHVAFNDNSSVRPATDAISTPLDLASILKTTTAFVGFTSGTGAGWENHDILNWQYTNTFSPISGPPSSAPVPEPATVFLLGTGVATIALRRRKQE